MNWISVKEKLPENDRQVLVFIVDKFEDEESWYPEYIYSFKIGSYNSRIDWEDNKWEFDDWFNPDVSQVQFWCELENPENIEDW